MITFLSKKLVMVRSLYLGAILAFSLWIVLQIHGFLIERYAMVALASINAALASAVFILIKDAREIRMHAAEKILLSFLVFLIFLISLVVAAIFYFVPDLD